MLQTQAIIHANSVISPLHMMITWRHISGIKANPQPANHTCNPVSSHGR